ncbi:MAG: response regulator [Methanoregula sp.]|uniref:response regulator n=1 Tax=Methanoregula sp. TaxID=2052170 RepID=UPI003BAFA0CF
MVQKISVLYVDDEPGLLEIGKIFLEKSGQFSVDIVTSAPDALAILATKTYDAILSDYQMPEMDGIEFLKSVRASGNTIPFLILTGRGREEIVIQALNEGANYYIQKGGKLVPQFTEIAHQIRHAVQERWAESDLRNLERRESDILDFMQEPTFTIDISGQVTSWNCAIENLTGVPATEILGKGDHEYAIPFFEKRLPILIDLILWPNITVAGRYEHITRDGDVLIADTILTSRTGSTVMLHERAGPLYNRDGEIDGAIESIKEIVNL